MMGMANVMGMTTRQSYGRCGGEMAGKDLVHGEHVHFINIKDGFEFGITNDESSIGGFLQIVNFDVIPDHLDDGCARQRFRRAEEL